MSEKKVNLGFRVTPERADELRLIAAQRKQKIQKMLERGLELLLAGTSETPGSTHKPHIDSPHTRAHNAQVEKLKHLEQAKIKALEKLSGLITEEANLLRQIETDPGSGGGSTTTRHRKRSSG